MRIVSGKYRGRRYSGTIPSEIRPTTDNLRETIFNILANNISFESLTIADICAGTGFMGFEALSRGASKCYYFEKSRKSIELIYKIAASFKIENFEVIKGDAVKKLQSFSINNPDMRFDLIFFDPPYGSNQFNNIINVINENYLLVGGGLMVVEESVSTQILLPENFEKVSEKTFGATRIIILKNRSANKMY